MKSPITWILGAALVAYTWPQGLWLAALFAGYLIIEYGIAPLLERMTRTR